VTAEQREKFRDMLAEHRTEIVGVAKPVVEKRRALRDAVLADHPDESAIRSAANDLGKAIGDAAVLAAKVKPEVSKVLTSEQRDKIKQFRTKNDKAVDEFIDKIASH
jgi:Spy/CpxP family protein refolding chaperone